MHELLRHWEGRCRSTQNIPRALTGDFEAGTCQTFTSLPTSPRVLLRAEHTACSQAVGDRAVIECDDVRAFRARIHRPPVTDVKIPAPWRCRARPVSREQNGASISESRSFCNVDGIPEDYINIWEQYWCRCGEAWGWKM